MMNQFFSGRRIVAVALLGAAFPALVSACSSGGTPAAGPQSCVDSANALKDANGNLALDSTGNCQYATTQHYVMPQQAADGTLPPAINDYGPAALTDADCTDPADVEIVLMDDFESGLATKWYTYNDSTCEVMPVPLKDWQPASTPIPAAWGGKRCNSTHAMHLAGSYTDWGAGLASLLMNHGAASGGSLPADTVPMNTVPPYYNDAQGNPIPPLDTAVPNFQSADLSAWDGITFWARRGPYGEPGFRPSILDKTTSGDLNRHLPPDKAECRSLYTVCSCWNGKPCTPWDPAVDKGPDPATIPQTGCYSGFAATPPEVAGTYCWDPKVDPWPSNDPTIRCGQTACDWRPTDSPVPTTIFNPVNALAAALYKQAPDGSMEDAKHPNGYITCSPEPYVFHDSTLPSAQFCYRPGIDADPPEKDERCENNWLGSVPIDTDWKRYYVAFADMRQDNTAPKKRSPGMDLTSVEVLSLVFPAGNLDIWVDDVGFYRKKK